MKHGEAQLVELREREGHFLRSDFDRFSSRKMSETTAETIWFSFWRTKKVGIATGCCNGVMITQKCGYVEIDLCCNPIYGWGLLMYQWLFLWVLGTEEKGLADGHPPKNENIHQFQAVMNYYNLFGRWENSFFQFHLHFEGSWTVMEKVELAPESVSLAVAFFSESSSFSSSHNKQYCYNIYIYNIIAIILCYIIFEKITIVYYHYSYFACTNMTLKNWTQTMQKHTPGKIGALKNISKIIAWFGTTQDICFMNFIWFINLEILMFGLQGVQGRPCRWIVSGLSQQIIGWSQFLRVKPC